MVARRWLIGDPGTTAMTAVAVLGTGLAGAGLIHNKWVACGALAAAGIGMSIAGALFFTIAQTATPPAFMGRVMSLIMFSSLGPMPVAYLLTGILSRVVGAPALFASAGGVEIAMALLGMTIPAMRNRDGSVQPQPTGPARVAPWD